MISIVGQGYLFYIEMYECLILDNSFRRRSVLKFNLNGHLKAELVVWET